MLDTHRGGTAMESSKELNNMLETKKRYRNDGYGGSRKTDVASVIIGEKEGLSPWLLTKELFQERVIPSEKATVLIQEYRAGMGYSKNKGERRVEAPTGDLVEVLLPIEAFTTEYLSYIEASVDSERVKRYQEGNIETPIYAFLSKKGNWVLSDGGHRLISKVRNEEGYIRALVPVSTYDWFASYKK